MVTEVIPIPSLANSNPKLETILTFLKQTREGKYAKIEKSSLRHPRIKEQSEDICCDDEAYATVYAKSARLA